MRTAQQICDDINSKDTTIFSLDEICNLVKDRDHWKDRALKSEGLRRETTGEVVDNGR